MCANPGVLPGYFQLSRPDLIAVRVKTANSKFRIARLAVGLTAWAIAIFACLGAAMKWEFAPGLGSAKAPTLASKSSSPTLIVVLHSQCTCSLATVDNLVDMPSSERSQLRIHLVFTGPGIDDSPIVRHSEALGAVEREFLSEDQVLTKYGARTSGQAYLYDANGRLRFSGGITDSRGYVGPSKGIEAIEAVLAGRDAISTSPVYGCALQTGRWSK
jgi:hypothetical protein